MFDFLFGSSTSTLNSVEKGREAMTYFFNRMKKYSSISFDQLLLTVAGSAKAVDVFLDGFGTAIIEIQKDDFLADSKVKTAMEKLADTSKGNIPNRNYFFSALSSEAQNVTFIDAIPSVVSGTVSEIGSGFQQIGESLIDTGKILTLIFPFVAIASILFIVKEKTKKAAGK